MTAAQFEEHQRKHGFPAQHRAVVTIPEAIQPKAARRGRLNKTEQEYARILESRKQRGEIAEYRFEGITLRWGADPKTGSAMRFTPDFVVYLPDGSCELHEVKGGFIRSRDSVRFPWLQV